VTDEHRSREPGARHLCAPRLRHRRVQALRHLVHDDPRPDIKAQVEAIYAEERYWPEPLIQINPSYKRTTDIKSLVAQGALDPRCADIFQTKGTPLSLYKHQEQAIALAEAGESYVVTTGTGSGKSLCFFIPIVHRVLVEKRRSGQARTRAIIIYPMNALANSQLEELGKFVGNVAGAPPITFARYTGKKTPRSASVSPTTRPTSCSPTS
jgi:ATP-dependent helicase YprA (DUF1998 family)